MTNLEQTRHAWEEHAGAYDQALTETDMRAAEEALRMAGVGPGTRLLDIAAGPGALSIPAARLGADVLAIDYSHAMVDLLTRKARDMGLANLRAQVMDGTALALADNSFDVACSELGIMLFPDRARGLSEMARVVRPGGTGVMVAFGPAPRVEPITLFFQAMAGAIPGFGPPQNSPLFCLQDLEVLRAEMEQAGFRDIRLKAFDSWMDVQSGEELWERIMAGAPAIAGLIRTVPEDRQRAVRRALVETIHARADGAGPVRLTMAFNIGVGTRESAPASAL